MTKLEEIKTRIIERIKRKDFDLKCEKKAYILGYLNALLDKYEIDSDEYDELLEDLYYV